MVSSRSLGLAALVVALVACGESNPDAKMPHGGDLAGAMPAEPPLVVRTPITALKRPEVKATVVGRGATRRRR